MSTFKKLTLAFFRFFFENSACLFRSAFAVAFGTAQNMHVVAFVAAQKHHGNQMPGFGYFFPADRAEPFFYGICRKAVDAAVYMAKPPFPLVSAFKNYALHSFRLYQRRAADWAAAGFYSVRVLLLCCACRRFFSFLLFFLAPGRK